MEWISEMIKVTKIPTKFIIVIFLVSSALSFLPEEALTDLKLAEFSKKFGLYIGITTLATCFILLMELITHNWKYYNILSSSIKFKKSTLHRLNQLDMSEKSVLREFYLQGQNTLKFPMDHPVIAGLISAGILRLVGQHGKMSTAGMLFSMKISDFAREKLNNELLDLPNGQPSEKDLNFLKNNRPSFIALIHREESLFN